MQLSDFVLSQVREADGQAVKECPACAIPETRYFWPPARTAVEDMMRKLMISLMALTIALPANAATTRCRDAHGHFTRCPPAGATAAAAAAHPAAAAGITRDHNGRCHAAGGRFVRCPAAAAH
jgi:hypothetical protein